METELKYDGDAVGIEYSGVMGNARIGRKLLKFGK